MTQLLGLDAHITSGPKEYPRCSKCDHDLDSEGYCRNFNCPEPMICEHCQESMVYDEATCEWYCDNDNCENFPTGEES